MAAQPVIAIFADTPARASYLETVVTLAGARPSSPGEAADISICCNKTLPEIKDVSGPVICVGHTISTLQDSLPPMRAWRLIETIQEMLSRLSSVPAELQLPLGIVKTREALWCPQGQPAQKLTEKETGILIRLYESNGQTVTRDELLDSVWKYAEGVETHTLETHMYRLRQKIEADPSQPIMLVTTENGYALKLDIT